MSKRRRFRIFISAVTGELGSYRQALARDLRRKGLDVCDQENFRQSDATLLEALRDYIKDCDAVVLLIGHRCGALATPEHAAALNDIPNFQAYSAATDQKQASYTQWEFYLAKHYRKKTYTFFAEAGFTGDPAQPETIDLQACQQAHRDWIKRLGEHRDLLTTSDRLAVDMLVQDFPSDPRAKPLNLPYRSIGTLFKGRDAFLADLRRSIARATGARASAIVNAVHGLGGVGKTRLAVEYAWQRQDDYNALLFVVAGSPEDLRRNLAALVGPLVLDLDEQEAKEEEVKVAAALRWLQNNPGWFLILDNVDTKDAAEAAEGLLAQLHAGDVLITSRLSRWSRQVEPLELDVLGEDDAVAFLVERTDRRRRKTANDEADARTLATELGELALALEQAGAYIEEQRLSFAQYLAQWQSNRDKVTEWFDPQVMQYPKSLAVTWQTSVAQLSEPARRLLKRLAWLAPDPIPESLLDVAVPGDENVAADARAALADLERYSLVTRAADAPAFTVHRLVQDVTRRSQQGDAGRTGLTQALGWVNRAFVGDTADVRTWPVLEPLASHAMVIAEHADAAAIADPTARLMNDLGRLFRAKALNTIAEPLYRCALAIDEKSFGADHPNVATRLNNLAQLLQATNRLTEAEPLMRRALAIDEARLEPSDPSVARDLNNLAGLLRVTNRLTEAEPLFRRVLDILQEVERATGRRHPKYATVLNNIAGVLAETNRMAEAEPLYRRALEIEVLTFGPNHPEVGRAIGNLATLLSELGRFEEAEPLRRRELRIMEQGLPEGHPYVATALSNLAQLLQDTGHVTDAEPLLRRALAIAEKSLGPDHPIVGTILNNMAQLLQAASRHCEAEPLMRRALEIDEKSFGPEHPTVATRLNNLALLLRATGRLGEAEPLSRRQFAIFLRFNRATGREHPNFQASRASYVAILEDRGRSEAEIEAEIQKVKREAGTAP